MLFKYMKFDSIIDGLVGLYYLSVTMNNEITKTNKWINDKKIMLFHIISTDMVLSTVKIKIIICNRPLW